MGIKFGGLVSSSVEIKVSRYKFGGWVERHVSSHLALGSIVVNLCRDIS